MSVNVFLGVELTAVDANLENWKAWAKIFKDELLLLGFSQETIEGVELFDVGETVPMPITCTKGFIPINRDVLGLALTRWLIENNAEERSSRFRENEKRLTEILLTLNQIETSGDVVTGQKFSGGRKVNSGSPIRKKIAVLLKINSKLKNNELWNNVAAKPPRGWTANDNRLGRYFEGAGVDNMGERRFNNICGEERKKLKTKITG